ncbi:TPA: hypothetical protein RXG36_001933 [Staphylococcus aureus]|nr:hypothetical protein [Staphylococcus aureus]
MQVGVGPNTEADEKSAYNNVQVGGAPTQKLTKSQLTIMCKLAGPQHSEIGFPISTDNASWRGPNIEAGGKSAYNNVQVGE